MALVFRQYGFLYQLVKVPQIPAIKALVLISIQLDLIEGGAKVAMIELPAPAALDSRSMLAAPLALVLGFS